MCVQIHARFLLNGIKHKEAVHLEAVPPVPFRCQHSPLKPVYLEQLTTSLEV